MNELATYAEQTAIAAASDYQASDVCTIAVTAETAKIIANAVNASLSLSKIGDTPFKAVGVMMKPGVAKARNANDVDKPCTDSIIVCKDGTAYFTKSEGIRRSLDTFVSLGIFTGEPVDMRVVSQEMPNGNTLKHIELI